MYSFLELNQSLSSALFKSSNEFHNTGLVPHRYNIQLRWIVLNYMPYRYGWFW